MFAIPFKRQPYLFAKRTHSQRGRSCAREGLSSAQKGLSCARKDLSSARNARNGLSLSDKKAIRQAINELDKPSEINKLQIELSSETLERLLLNEHIHITEIRCLNKQSKKDTSRCLLNSCHLA